MCVVSVLIPHFVPIISKVMGPNTAIHTNIRATEATTLENGGFAEKELEGKKMQRKKKHDDAINM